MGSFGSKPKAPPPPPPIIEPTPMPVVDAEANTKAKKVAAERIMGRTGRDSTILTDKLGA